MSTMTSNIESMKEAMTKALQQSNHANPSTVSALISLLGEAQEALREGGYAKAVLEMRQGLQTDYGLRYTAYLRDEASTFENPLFSVFIGSDHCTFQAEGQLQSGLNDETIIEKAREYLLRPYVVELMTGLLRQFGRNTTALTVETPSTALG